MDIQTTATRSRLPRREASLRLAKPPKPRIPPLVNGDTLDADEFIRRYKEMPEEVKKAELIDGIVYIMFQFVSSQWHAIPDGLIQGWMSHYSFATVGVENLPNPTIRLGPKNSPQPDALLRIIPEKGGRTVFGEDGCLVGPAELVAEISSSSVSIDVGKKKEAYRLAGLQEYLAWRIEENQIDWWYLENGEYRQLPRGNDGIIRSGVLPGLWLDTKALLARDRAGILKVLKRGLKSPEYKKFAKRLKS